MKIPKGYICEEEMWSAHLDSNEVIIEYITDAHGNRIKKLKPILIKSEPDREYTHHVVSDDDLPAVLEENFTQKREVTIDSYSESISSNDVLCNIKLVRRLSSQQVNMFGQPVNRSTYLVDRSTG